jgi:RNA polymerase sigma-70 factor, ECF subfamily
VRRALMRLSIEHREVIDLVYYHERSVDEAAQILDVPPATVLCAKEIGRIGQWG